ncbi:hypothetical protein EDC04DRAFT_1010420 [Pisolithus marmoratus]|nr:hypothetical protein EDC04DRAFT_1010420 [Pisolithus marmoratus]
MTETDSLSELFAGKREENALPACQSKSPIVSRVMPCNLLKGKGLSKDPCLEVIFPLLLRRCQILCRQDGVSRRYADTKQEIVHEVKSISQTLSASLLQHISATFARQMTDCASHLDYDRQLDPRSAVQEIMALQAKLNAVEDEDEQRALGEDVTGKILWFYWCGICVEVDELLPKVPNCIWREGVLEGLLEIRRIIEETHTEPGDDQAHLQRIMLDAGAGTSKHQLLLTARVAEQAKWSCATALGDASIREATPGASIQIPFTSVDNIGSTSTASRSN